MAEKNGHNQYIIEENRLVRVIESYPDFDIIVPEGVEIICAKAAYESHACRVVLPESLKRIESDAFGSINEISHPVHIPASVEYIAVDAFSDDREEPELRFTVDERNPYYYAEDGVLYERKAPEPGIYDEREVLPLTNPEIRARVKEWDIVSLGRYPQTAQGTDDSPVEWLVLCVRDGKALLISRYALDTMPYDAAGIEGTSWRRCSLRAWMNDMFFHTAFNAAEQDLILMTKDAEDKGCDDSVFAISTRETECLFRNSHTGRANFISGWIEYDENAPRCLMTPYAAAQGAERDDETEGDYAFW